MNANKKNEVLSDDIIENARKSLDQWVWEAHKRAMQEGIEANTVLLNDHFCKVNGFPFCSGNYYVDIPPMICGLEVRVSSELPPKYDFAVVEVPMTEREKLIRETTERVKKETIEEFAEKLKTYYNAIGGATFGALVAYTIDQKAKEMTGKCE